MFDRLDYQLRCPATIIAPVEADRAAKAAASVVGQNNVIGSLPPSMGAEDFAWMLPGGPGCYVHLGTGSEGHGSCVVHSPRYDFNDDAFPVGASFWAALVEEALPLSWGWDSSGGVASTGPAARPRPAG